MEIFIILPSRVLIFFHQLYVSIRNIKNSSPSVGFIHQILPSPPPSYYNILCDFVIAHIHTYVIYTLCMHLIMYILCICERVVM